MQIRFKNPWWVVFGAVTGLIVCNGPILNYSFGVFLKPIMADMGWDRGTASFALPRAEVGQGITTAIAMVIADELELPLDKVNITLSDARPELEFNQLTGGSNSMHVLYDQVRVAAAIARGQLALTAAQQLETPLPKLTLKDGVITAPDGRALSYGSLTSAAAAPRTQAVLAQLKPASQQTLVGTPQPRIDALEPRWEVCAGVAANRAGMRPSSRATGTRWKETTES